MIYIVCKECQTAIQLSGDHAEVDSLVGSKSEWYPDSYPCTTDGCTNKMELVDAIDALALPQLEMYKTTPQEAFAAFHGLGLPEEHDCGPTAVEKLLVGQRVVKINSSLMKGANRTIIYSLVFEDGTEMHLGSSPYGATVYRIGKRRSFVKEVLNNV